MPAAQAKALLVKVRPRDLVGKTRRRLDAELAADLEQNYARKKAADKELKALVAATGTGQAALLSAELRRLDRDAIARLEAAGVAVVGLVEPGDDEAAARLRRLGVHRVLPADAEPDAIAQALREAVGTGPASGRDVADPRAALPVLGAPDEPDERPAGRGRVVAVWGPTGAPGRTTVAVGIADEAARLGVSSMSTAG